MTYGTYVDMPLGPHRGGVDTRSGPTLWIVIHTSEPGTAAESDTMAESLARFIATPGTYDSNGNPVNVASYHLVTDTDKLLRFMDDSKRANGASGANDRGLHICFPGQAAQTREQWLDPITNQYMDRAAEAVADWHVKYGIPLVKIGPADLVAGRSGVCGHVDVHEAFHLTTHTDPGPGFPYDVLLARANALLNSQENDVTPEQMNQLLAAIAAVNADTDALSRKVANLAREFGEYRAASAERETQMLTRIDRIPTNNQMARAERAAAAAYDEILTPSS